jgi:hypothetical protein
MGRVESECSKESPNSQDLYSRDCEDPNELIVALQIVVSADEGIGAANRRRFDDHVVSRVPAEAEITVDRHNLREGADIRDDRVQLDRTTEDTPGDPRPPDHFLHFE